MSRFLFLSLILFSLLFLGCEKKITEPFPEKISLWVSGNEEDVRFFEALSLEFNSKISQNIDFEISLFPSQEKLQEEFLSSLAENKGPDIVFVDFEFISRNFGKFSPLKDDPSLSLGNFKQKFVPSAYKTLFFENSLYGAPLFVDTLALLYNKQILSSYYGENISSETVFTWDEISRLSQNLTQKDSSSGRFLVSGIALGRSDNIRHFQDIILLLLRQNNAKLFADHSGEVLVTEPQGVSPDGTKKYPVFEVFSFFRTFAEPDSPFFSWNSDFVSDFDAFLDGKLVFYFAKASDLRIIRDFLKEENRGEKPSILFSDIGSVFPPQQKKGDPLYSYSSGKALAVSRISEYPEFSWKFLKFALQENNLRSYSYTFLLPSSLQSILLEQEENNLLIPFIREAKNSDFLALPISSEKLKNVFHKFFQILDTGGTILENFPSLQKYIEDSLPVSL